MATFPTLKTGAVAQYPATRSLQFRNQTVRFVDGSEQRYRDSAGPLHRWQIRLDLLDEGELAAVDAFLSDCQGAFASFEFTDPWDGQTYKNCSLETDGMDLTMKGEMLMSTSLTVVENRG
jgi:phage-related protein